MSEDSAPPVGAVREIAQSIRSEVGDLMSELFSALDDLIWDHYQLYQQMPPEQRAIWQEAVRAELQEGYNP